MRKLVMLASSAALLGASTTAAVASPEPYVGAQMGYQDTSLEYGYKESSNVGPGQYSQTTDFSASGVAGSLFAGAKFSLGEGFFIAPEVNLGTSTADGGISRNSSGFGSSSYELEAEAGQSYGLGVLLGKNLTSDTTIYGRLGYQRTEYEVSESGTNVDNWSEDETFGGVRYGIGMETALVDSLALRLDWSQTQYSDESFSEDMGTYTVTESFEPTESLFQVGLSYTF